MRKRLAIECRDPEPEPTGKPRRPTAKELAYLYLHEHADLSQPMTPLDLWIEEEDVRGRATEKKIAAIRAIMEKEQERLAARLRSYLERRGVFGPEEGE